MKPLWVIAGLLTASLLGIAAPPPSPLCEGAKVELRVRQVIPKDGLSRGERMLNSLPVLQAGDVFTAELVETPGQASVILAGCVESVTPPKRFGRPGKVSVKLAWPVGPDGSNRGRWGFDIEDQRFTSAQRRRAITALFMLDGAILGAAAGTALVDGKSGATLGGIGVGMLLGTAYASFQPGQAASLEPGDTLAVELGATYAKKLPPELPLKIFPAHEPEEKHKGKKP